jgi:hypothetical protein
MPVNDLYQARIICFQGSQIAVNIRHYVVTNVTGVEGTANNLATIIDTQFAPHYKPLINSNASYRGVGVKLILPVQGVESAVVMNSGLGSGGVDSLPKQCAGLIQLQTVVGGRHGRGRVYIPFPSEQHSDANGAPTAAYGTLLTTLAADFLLLAVYTSGPNTTTWAPCIFNRGTGTFIKLNPGGATNSRTKWASQRRRGDFGKSNVLPW